jgi:hypothetical protein
VRKAEEQQNDLAAKVGQGARLAIVIRQLKVAREISSGNVGRPEFVRGTSRHRQQENEYERSRRAHQNGR